MSANFCSKCGGAVRETAKFCPACGATLKPSVSQAVSEALTQCPQCHGPLRPGVMFCPACNYQILPSAYAAPVAAPVPQPVFESTSPAAPLPTPALPQARSAAQPDSKLGLDWKKALLLGCGGLAALCVLAVGLAFVLEPTRNGILALVYTPTPTSTPTATPNYQATNAAATSIASTATASARFATQTAQAAATAAASTATAVFQKTQAAATTAAAQTQAAGTQQARQATQKAIADLNLAVQKICQGSGEPGAAQYTNRAAFHPIIIFPDNYPYPDEAHAGSLEQLELVACVEESQVTVRSKPYEAGYICNEQINRARITIRAAQTGKVIRTNDVNGSNPVACQSVETFQIGVTYKYKVGGPVAPDQVWEKIKDLVRLELKSAFDGMMGFH